MGKHHELAIYINKQPSKMAAVSTPLCYQKLLSIATPAHPSLENHVIAIPSISLQIMPLFASHSPPWNHGFSKDINVFRVPGHDVSATERGVVDLPPAGCKIHMFPLESWNQAFPVEISAGCPLILKKRAPYFKVFLESNKSSGKAIVWLCL